MGGKVGEEARTGVGVEAGSAAQVCSPIKLKRALLRSKETCIKLRRALLRSKETCIKLRRALLRSKETCCSSARLKRAHTAL